MDAEVFNPYLMKQKIKTSISILRKQLADLEHQTNICKEQHKQHKQRQTKYPCACTTRNHFTYSLSLRLFGDPLTHRNNSKDIESSRKQQHSQIPL